MSEVYKRRIRVEGKPDALNGFALTVHDADTGEVIEHVYCIDMHLGATQINTATIHYYDFDSNGEIVVKDGTPIKRSLETDNPEVALTALETMPLIEQLQAEVNEPKRYREENFQQIMRRCNQEVGQTQSQKVIQAVKEQEAAEVQERARKEREMNLRAFVHLSLLEATATREAYTAIDMVKVITDRVMQAIHEYAV